jgi:hypothetical protein
MITCQMITVVQETMQKPMEEVEQVEMVMEHKLTKALYGLLDSVMQEVYSTARIDVKNLDVGKGVTEML